MRHVSCISLLEWSTTSQRLWVYRISVLYAQKDPRFPFEKRRGQPREFWSLVSTIDVCTSTSGRCGRTTLRNTKYLVKHTIKKKKKKDADEQALYNYLLIIQWFTDSIFMPPRKGIMRTYVLLHLTWKLIRK